MKKIYLCFALTAAVVVACDKAETDLPLSGEDLVPEVKMIVETISGTSGSNTRATIADSDASFKWTVGDNIAVHVSKDDEHMYVFTSGTGGADAAAATAKFVVAYPAGYSRDAFAVYPSTIVVADAANYGQSGHALAVTLPSSYTLDQVTDETSPCPMIADNTQYNWTFYQLCGLLRLTVNCIHPRAKRLEIDFDGKKVAGNFSIPNPKGDGTSPIALENASGNNSSVISITKDGSNETFNSENWKDGLVLNIPLPTGDYTKITVRAYDALTEGNVLYTNEKTRPFAYTASNEYATKKTVSFDVFSVGDDKRVVFAPGNLQATYDITNNLWTWSFADNQYDYIGNNPGNTKINGNGTLSQDGTIDLFGRSTGITDNIYYGIATSITSTDYSGTFVDWGSLDIKKNATPPYTYYPTNFWYTLSEAEWKYVLGEADGKPIRTRGGVVDGVSNALCSKATVNGICGFIIFPDYYDGGTPSGVTWVTNAISPGNMTNSATKGWGATVSLAGWTVLENEGCIFLPAAGYSFSNGSVNNPGGVGRYRSSGSSSGSSPDPALRFDNDGFDPNQSGNNGYKFSVRLAHEVN